MQCSTCNHDKVREGSRVFSTGPNEVHAPGKCANCNCGESYVTSPYRYRGHGPSDGNFDNPYVAGERMAMAVRPGTRFRGAASEAGGSRQLASDRTRW
jgi:hypothetical protein